MDRDAMRSAGLYLFLAPLIPACTPAPRAEEVMEAMTGHWHGRLVYMDYGSGREVSIPAACQWRRLSARQWIIRSDYPEEPEEASVDTIVLADDATSVDGLSVIQVDAPTQGAMRLMLEGEGTDDGQPVTIREQWEVGPGWCRRSREVKTGTAREFSLRHRYEFERTVKER